MYRHALMFVILATGCKDDKPKPAEAKVAPMPADAAPMKDSVTWQAYTSPTGKFSMDLPGKPAEHVQGAITMVGAEFGTTASDPRTAMCGAGYMARPAAATDTKAMLDGATKHYRESATVIEDKDITLDKNPGRSLIVQNDSHRKWVRAYVTATMLYFVNCGGPFDRAATDGPIALKALDSFKLTK